MVATFSGLDVSRLVDNERGLVDRRIFTDEEIYRQELEQIFGRAWLVLGHETQIPRPGDFFTTWMGEDSVVVCRDAHGGIRAFLNSCRHRGNRVTRLDCGQASRFMCTYHGWTYDLEGKLVGVPSYDECYHGELDRAEWGLVPVAQLDTYLGLIFATWDPTAPPLLEYLDEDIRWGLEASFSPTPAGVEVVGGIFKWTIPCNWKFPTDNIGDDYHGPFSHRSNRLVKGQHIDMAAITGSNEGNFTITTRYGHSINVNDGGERSNSPHIARQRDSDYSQQLENIKRERLGEFRSSNSVRVGVFPNCFASRSMHIFHPRGPLMTEDWIYVFVDKDAPEEVKYAARRLSNQQGMSPGGMMAQDDIENWEGSTIAAKGVIAQRYPLNYQMGLSNPVAPREGELPPRQYSRATESMQRRLFKNWADMMAGKDWDEIGR